MDNNKNKDIPVRSVMRAMLNSKEVDSNTTFSYTDRQVVNLFQFALCAGILLGGVSVAAVMRIIGL